jgi:ABC-type multidrug transport system fused ATPase/permease subunit
MALFIRFLQFARRYRGPVIVSILLVFVTTGLSMPLPFIAGVLTDKIVAFLAAKPEGAAETSAQVVSQASTLHYLWLICGVLLALQIVNGIIGFVRSQVLIYVGNRVVFDIRQRLFRHVNRLSMRYFESHSHGQIMSRILYDVDAVQSVLSGGVVDMITNLVTVLVVIAIIFYQDWRLATIAVLVLPLYVANFFILRARIHLAAAETRDQYSEIYSLLSESISGIRVVKSFAREQHEARKFVKESREFIDIAIRAGRWRTLLGVNAGFLTGLASIVILAYGSYEIIATNGQAMTIGTLGAFRAYQGMLYGPIIALVTINDMLNWVSAAIERIFETLDTMPDVQEAKEPVRLTTVEGRVEFKSVGFSYEPGEPVLDDISFVANSGKVVALVGPSGSGKTTLIHLIPRFYDAQEGEILIDGINLKDIQLASLRRNIGMVLQEKFLFSGTLRDNIKYGRPEASDEDVVQAAIAANCHDFIMEFPDGYETTVGERGTRLSGGQRQRISIARALLTNPRLLILDEATSDLDSESEALIQEALETLMKGRTTFIIAHRLSTVMNADEILVLDHGKIVERGTHAELATAGGLYEKLCEVQFKRAQEKIEEHQAALKAEADAESDEPSAEEAPAEEKPAE